MKRLTSFVRCGSLVKWLSHLQVRAAAGGASTRSAQGDTWLDLGQEYAFAGQVRATEGGVRVLPFFWQELFDVYSTHSVPTTSGGTSLLEDPVIPAPSEEYVVALVMDGRIDDVSANAETNVLSYTRTISSVQVQVHPTLPATVVAEIRAQRGVTAGDDPLPFFNVTEVQPEARYVIPIANVKNQQVVHSFGLSSEWVHGRGLVLLSVPVNTFVEDIV